MEVTCTTCLKVFNRKPSQVKTHNYCSNTCFHQSLVTAQIKECTTCHKPVQKKPSDITKSITGNVFCSHSCSAMYSNKQRGGYGVTQYRIQAFKAFEHRCNRCGFNTQPGILEVHHKDRDRTNNSLANLEILCPNCHCLEHYLAKDGKFSFCT